MYLLVDGFVNHRVVDELESCLVFQESTEHKLTKVQQFFDFAEVIQLEVSCKPHARSVFKYVRKLLGRCMTPSRIVWRSSNHHAARKTAVQVSNIRGSSGV